MSECEVTAMLDRAAARTPPMDVPIAEVVGIGRARRRRRRVAGSGMTLAGVVLAGGLWWGLGTDAAPGLLGPEVGQPAATSTEETTGEPVGEGGHVTLLGDTYEVTVDEHGWPMLLEEDGSVFLRVSDVDGPPRGSEGGGVIMWREHWWPWSDRHQVHFSYSLDPDSPPGPGPGVSGQDAVTITGPAGEVHLLAVPAGS